MRGGKERETVGIWMWSEIFTHDFDSGEKVAIILTDTQGIFDNQSSLTECISIFAISMLLSSIQCYNVMRQVQEDDLTNLQLFTEYAGLAMENSNEKTFQKLIFIVRDWPSPDDNDFGPDEEKKFVKDLLAKTEKQTTDMHELRNHINESFNDICAFLLPYPGKDVAQQRNVSNNDTKKIKIEPDFLACVKELAETIFDPKNLIPKKIGGAPVKACEFLKYFEKYVEIFSGTELPEPKTILQVYFLLFYFCVS